MFNKNINLTYLLNIVLIFINLYQYTKINEALSKVELETSVLLNKLDSAVSLMTTTQQAISAGKNLNTEVISTKTIGLIPESYILIAQDIGTVIVYTVVILIYFYPIYKNYYDPFFGKSPDPSKLPDQSKLPDASNLPDQSKLPDASKLPDPGLDSLSKSLSSDSFLSPPEQLLEPTNSNLPIEAGKSFFNDHILELIWDVLSRYFFP